MKIGKNFENHGVIEQWNPHLVDIGDDCLLGAESRLVLHGAIVLDKKTDRRIIMRDLSWVGFRCLIFPGVTLGRCSLIGAGSNVTKSVPPYHIACGNPAKVIRKRHLAEIIKFYTIRIKMKGVLGVHEPDYSLLTQHDIGYALGIGTEHPYDPDITLDGITTLEKFFDTYAPDWKEHI
jgi:tetrahydrodipicolinate N-succinyltransferase